MGERGETCWGVGREGRHGGERGDMLGCKDRGETWGREGRHVGVEGERGDMGERGETCQGVGRERRHVGV